MVEFNSNFRKLSLTQRLTDNTKHCVLTTSLTAFLLAANTAFADEAKQGMLRTPLLQNSVTLPSNNINAKVIRVNFPVGFKTPWHTHDGPGPRYVVKGTLKVSENSKENTYAAGEVFWESGSKMMVENIDQEPAELIIFEMAPNR